MLPAPGSSASQAPASGAPASGGQATPPAAARDAAPATADAGPRFDVARIGPTGSTVVAGRATPGAEVTLRDQGRELGSARADSRGEFVILPNAPLAAGTHELSLQSRDNQGQERQGQESVVVIVPEAPARTAANGTTAQPQTAPAGQAMAVLMPPAGSNAVPRVLQGAQPVAGRLGLDVVDYDEAGNIRFAGSAPATQPLRLYIDQRHAGDAVSDAEGRWIFRPATGPAPGQHVLRVDQIGPQGRVVARVEVPFLRDAAATPAALAAATPGADRIVVQPGHSLWRIARTTYGRGIRYTVIHKANSDQIRDPGRIYPGQIFTLPAP
jgi:nucleoid-associated protein YgaU